MGCGGHSIWSDNDSPIELLMTDIQSCRIFQSHATFWSRAYGEGVPSSTNRHRPRTDAPDSGRRKNGRETAIIAARKGRRCRVIRAHGGWSVEGGSRKGSEDEGAASRWRREQTSRRDDGVKVV